MNEFEKAERKTNNYDKAYHEEISRLMAEKKKKEGPSFFENLLHGIGSVIKKSMENYLVVSHEGTVKFRISLVVVALLFMIFHGAIIVAMIVSLFLGVKYSISGKADLAKVNAVIGDAGDRASAWWGNYRQGAEVDDLCRKYDADDKK